MRQNNEVTPIFKPLPTAAPPAHDAPRRFIIAGARSKQITMSTVSATMTSILSSQRIYRLAVATLTALALLALAALPSRADTVAAQAAASSAAASLAALDPPLPVPDSLSADARARSAQSGVAHEQPDQRRGCTCRNGRKCVG